LNFSADSIISSISLLSKPDPEVMVIYVSLPVPKSLADTLTIPEASISKVTSIYGTPFGAAGKLVKSKFPNFLLSLANYLSPYNTLTVTVV